MQPKKSQPKNFFQPKEKISYTYLLKRMFLNEKSFLRRRVRTDFLLKGKFLIITRKKKTIFYAQRKDF